MHLKSMLHPWFAIIAFICLLPFALPAAQASARAAAASPFAKASATPEMTEEDLGKLFDTIFPKQLARNEIAGAAVAVVLKGKIMFAKGYGFADAATRKPVSATNTLFRIGSVSKLITSTAVMQLVEQGKIDLDADVNQYLDFSLPPAFGKPVTMRHLLTHTAGFEDKLQGLWVPDADDASELRPYLATRIPRAIHVPGTVGAYSNYGAALAGYIVQRVSGEPFPAYVARHITAPLHMSHTTFAQPLPAPLAPLMSSGYQRVKDGAMPFELMQAPAGGASATAVDMARFMIAHLQAGSVDGVRILRAATVAMMQAPQYSLDPRDNAVGFGWVGGWDNGHHIVGHDGATFYFHANLNLIPDADAGLFVVYNSRGNGAEGTLGPVFRAFMDRYYPYAPEPFESRAGAVGNTDDIAGSYMPSRRGQFNMAYLAALLGQTRVSMNDDGTLKIADLMHVFQRTNSWRETEPGLWRDTTNPQRHLIFKQDSLGRWQFSAGNPVNIYQRAAWYQDNLLILALLIFSLGTCVLSVVMWPIAAWQSARAKPHPTVEWRQTPIHLAAAVNLLLWGAAAALLAFAATHLELLPGKWFDIALRALQLAGWLGASGVATLIWTSRSAWRAEGQSGFANAHQALVWMACLASAWIALQANLLALEVRY